MGGQQKSNIAKILLTFILFFSFRVSSSFSQEGISESSTSNHSIGIEVGGDDLDGQFFSLETDFELNQEHRLSIYFGTSKSDNESLNIDSRSFGARGDLWAYEDWNLILGLAIWKSTENLQTSTLRVGVSHFFGDFYAFIIPQVRGIRFETTNLSNQVESQRSSNSGLELGGNYRGLENWNFGLVFGFYFYNKLEEDLKSDNTLRLVSNRSLDLLTTFIRNSSRLSVGYTFDPLYAQLNLETVTLISDNTNTTTGALTIGWVIDETWESFIELGKTSPENDPESNFASLGVVYKF